MTEWLDPEDFMEWLDRTYRRKICAMVHARYPGFSQHDVDDVWSETLWGVFGRRSDENRGGNGLGRLLKIIACRRACDQLRRMNTRKNVIHVKAEEVQAKAASEEQGGASWWGRLDGLERRELRYQANEAFRLLSPDEWLVLAVYCEHYPKIRRPAQLLALLIEEFPEVRHKGWSAADVKKLLDQARTIVYNHLCRKGYELDFGS